MQLDARMCGLGLICILFKKVAVIEADNFVNVYFFQAVRT
jgi:hypothetical protein